MIDPKTREKFLEYIACNYLKERQKAIDLIKEITDILTKFAWDNVKTEEDRKFITMYPKETCQENIILYDLFTMFGEETRMSYGISFPYSDKYEEIVFPEPIPRFLMTRYVNIKETYPDLHKTLLPKVKKLRDNIIKYSDKVDKLDSLLRSPRLGIRAIKLQSPKLWKLYEEFSSKS